MYVSTGDVCMYVCMCVCVPAKIRLDGMPRAPPMARAVFRSSPVIMQHSTPRDCSDAIVAAASGLR